MRLLPWWTKVLYTIPNSSSIKSSTWFSPLLKSIEILFYYRIICSQVTSTYLDCLQFQRGFALLTVSPGPGAHVHKQFQVFSPKTQFDVKKTRISTWADDLTQVSSFPLPIPLVGGTQAELYSDCNADIKPFIFMIYAHILTRP